MKANLHIRIGSLLLALLTVLTVLCAIPFSASAETATATITAINAQRGEGHLIIYTSEYGMTTMTNEWGAEAVVGADHVVTEVGKNNRVIPEGGFVVSGHDTDTGEGRMKTWVLENIKVGDYVYYDENSMLLTVSDQPLEYSNGGFYQVETKYTGQNQVRHEDEMIIYTPAFGTKTKTNEYGCEVVVENGLIISIGGNNSTIPKNGYVISGHGKSILWLQSNARLGMEVELEESTRTLRLLFNARSLEAGLTIALDALPAQLAEAKASYLYMDYDAFETRYNAAVQSLRQAMADYRKNKNDEALVEVGNALQKEVNYLTRSITESYTVQYRAAWLRPSQKSAAEVDAYVKKLHDQGINTICVEGNYDNTVILNTPKGCLFEHNPAFAYDVLQAYIDACHKYNMECHLWMTIFLVGHPGTTNYRKSVAFKKPEWLSLDQNGNSTNDYNFAMIDPANKEAREYLLSFYTYILQNYDIDCFQLDYIRYYDRTEKADFGYTQEAFEGFEKRYRHGVTPTYDMTASYWNDWVEYRKSCVSELVKGVREIINTYKPSVLLSADVVPSIAGAGANNYQNYPQWQKDKLLDLLHPMAYADGYGKDIKEQVALGGDRCMVVTGLGVFTASLGADDMVRQSIEDNSYGTYGEAYFEASSYLQDRAGEALKQTVYRNDALAPFLDRDASIRACLAYMEGRITDVILPLGGLTAEEAEAIRAAISDASDSVKDSKIAAEQLKALQTSVNKVTDPKAKKALLGDLLRAERITCVTYRTTTKDLLSELSVPDPEPFPDFSDPYTPTVSETGSEAGSEETPSESDAETPSEGDTSAPQSGSSALPWIIGGSVAVIVIVAVVLVLLRKK